VEKVGEQLPAVATTVAGLILVFLGLIFTAWSGYTAAEKDSVRSRVRRQAWILFLAFLLAILSATFSLISLGTSHQHPWEDYAGTAVLALSAILMIVVAFSGLMEL
jgi:ABC-type dipeptide/oligopeptide/nickel transport system permease subunit